MKLSDLEDAMIQDLQVETIDMRGDARGGYAGQHSTAPQRAQGRDDDAGAGLPQGWLDCPPYGKRFDVFIPCKVKRFPKCVPLKPLTTRPKRVRFFGCASIYSKACSKLM